MLLCARRVLDLSNNYFDGPAPAWLESLYTAGVVAIDASMNCISFSAAFTVAVTERANCVLPPANSLGNVGITAGELSALQDFYAATNGPSWTISTGWMSSADPCTWFGVTCDASPAVVSLYFVNNNLGGTLPASIGDLSNLQSLYIYSDCVGGVAGSLPASFTDLSNLQTLDLTCNQFTGSIPVSIDSLSALTYVTSVWFLILLNTADNVRVSYVQLAEHPKQQVQRIVAGQPGLAHKPHHFGFGQQRVHWQHSYLAGLPDAAAVRVARLLTCLCCFGNDVMPMSPQLADRERQSTVWDAAR